MADGRIARSDEGPAEQSELELTAWTIRDLEPARDIAAVPDPDETGVAK